MGKVLQFPSNYKPENPPEIDTSAAETRENFAWCEQLAEGIMYSCLKNLQQNGVNIVDEGTVCLLYTSPSPRDKRQSRMPSSA